MKRLPLCAAGMAVALGLGPGCEDKGLDPEPSPPFATAQFHARTDYQVGGQRVVTVAGDFDRDGSPDVVAISEEFPGSDLLMEVFLNDGGGCLDRSGEYEWDLERPARAEVCDLDNDGDLDVFAFLESTHFGAAIVIQNLGDGSFGDPVVLPDRPLLSDAKLVDIDRDGLVDVVAAKYRSTDSLQGVVLYRNSGGFIFDSTHQLVLEEEAQMVACADLDADGDMDLVASKTPWGGRPYHLLVFFNSGSLTFDQRHEISLTSPLGYMICHDFSGDGLPDLAYRENLTPLGRIYYRAGLGHLGFGNPVALEIAAGRSRLNVLHAADADDDGDLDLLVPVEDFSHVTLLENTGGGTFAPWRGIFQAIEPFSADVADIDGDGLVDIVTGSIRYSQFSVIEGSSSSDFELATPVPVSTQLRAMKGADFNADGLLDLVTADAKANEVTVLLNNGAGTYGVSQRIGSMQGAGALEVTDYDLDGDSDVIVVEADANRVSVLDNDGTGTFAVDHSAATGAWPVCIAALDLDKDGDPDICVGNSRSDSITVLANSGGHYVPAPALSYGGTPQTFTVADFDLDGDIDLAVAGRPRGSNALHLYPSRGDGTFEPYVYIRCGDWVVDQPERAFAADIDADGDHDFIALGGYELFVVRNDGAGVFTPGPRHRTGDSPKQVCVKDYNRDGHLDVAVLIGQGAHLGLFYGDGTAGLSGEKLVGIGHFPTAAVAADVDGDSDVDLVTADLNGSVYTVLNTGTGPPCATALSTAP